MRRRKRMRGGEQGERNNNEVGKDGRGRNKEKGKKPNR